MSLLLGNGVEEPIINPIFNHKTISPPPVLPSFGMNQEPGSWNLTGA
jgi:hypothetical protein